MAPLLKLLEKFNAPLGLKGFLSTFDLGDYFTWNLTNNTRAFNHCSRPNFTLLTGRQTQGEGGRGQRNRKATSSENFNSHKSALNRMSRHGRQMTRL
jgi:hypothetical protein